MSDYYWDRPSRHVPGYMEGLLQQHGVFRVTDLGEVYKVNWRWGIGTDPNVPALMGYRLLRASRLKSGYYNIHLYRETFKLHRVVALAWHGPRPRGRLIRHLNGDPGDNRPENLHYGTPSDNAHDRWFHQRQRQARAWGLPLDHIVWRGGR